MLRSSLTAIGAAISTSTAESPGEDTVVIERKHYPRVEIETIRASLPSVSASSLRPWEVESDDEKARREAEQLLLARDHYVFNIFKIFDTDMSGGIDVKEFRDLAFMLGESMTEYEAEDCVSALDADRNGSIEFSEFLAWWNKEDVSAFGGGTEGFRAKLNLLKLRLQSRSYMRTVQRLLRRSLEGAKSMKDDVGKVSPGSTTDDFLTVDVSVVSGSPYASFDTSTGIRIESRGEDEQEYSVNAEFVVNEDADMDEVRALVSKLQGYVNTFLVEGMPPGMNPPEIMLEEDREEGVVLKMAMTLPEDFTMFGQIAGQIDARLSITTEYMEADDVLGGTGRLRALIEVPYSVAEMAKMAGAMPIDPVRASKLVKGVTFTVEVASGKEMQGVMKEFLEGLPLPPGITLPPMPDADASPAESLVALKKMYATQLAQAITMIDALPEGDRGLAQDALVTYYSIVKLLKGVLVVDFAVGPKAVAFRSLDLVTGAPKVLPVFTILPGEDDVKEASACATS